MSSDRTVPSREQILHMLYEASELEHNLMCTYLYAAFGLRQGEEEGLLPDEVPIVARWRSTILRVAIEEMSHLTAVWNITSALGGSPRFGRGNFPLDPGALPAGVVVKLAPFDLDVLQHFIHLERPIDSTEPDGAGFEPELTFTRSAKVMRLTPMAIDYDTVGAFYATLGESLRAFVASVGESAAFAGDPALQLSPRELTLAGARTVICSKTALAAFTTIVEQGEGAPLGSSGSHYQRFLEIREELRELKARRPSFEPSFPAAVNPVYRPPLRPQNRVWIQDEEAATTVDLANTGYSLMLRLLAYAYAVPSPSLEKGLAVDLALQSMRAVTLLAEHAARLPSGSSPGCNAGMSFAALRDASSFAPGRAARRFFVERTQELATAAAALATKGDDRVSRASKILTDVAGRASRGFEAAAAEVVAPKAASAPTPVSTATSTIVDGVEQVEGKHLTLYFEGRRCIHARFCVTGAPTVFLANVQGPWIHPDTIEPEKLVEVAHACPSGAIRYRRKDGKPDETAPPVNLLAVREAGPYAVRGDLRIDGRPAGYRATLCRCGASKKKPYCDGSHHDVPFTASGEPATGKTEMLTVRDGPLAIDPQPDGPLSVRGNLEVVSGTGRCVERLQQANFCRCGHSDKKPFCDGSHARVGFKS